MTDYTLDNIINNLKMSPIPDDDAEAEGIYIFQREWEKGLLLQMEFTKNGELYQMRYAGIVDRYGEYQYIK